MIVRFYFNNYTRFEENAADTTSQMTLHQNKLVLNKILSEQMNIIIEYDYTLTYKFNGIFKSYYSYTMPTKLFLLYSISIINRILLYF